MENIALARAAHLFVFVDLLQEMGASVDVELKRSKLPSSVEECPDDFISVSFALDFVAHCAGAVPIAEFAFMAAQRASLAMLHRDFQLSLLQAACGLAKFNALVHHAERENTVLVAGIARNASKIRVICDLEPFRGHPALACAEWLIQRVMISIARSVAGPDWCPLEMTFMAPDAFCNAAVERFADCRLLAGQSHTSILFPIEQIAGPPAQDRTAADAELLTRSAPLFGDGFVSTLRMAIRPYLADGYPDIGLAAEIAGLSRRTLQRELARRGRTYSEVVREVRFDAACGMLGDPAVKIIDVAFETGYANPQHFSRAFRQRAGMSPRAYRKHCTTAQGGRLALA